jgi:hypothetical protein
MHQMLSSKPIQNSEGKIGKHGGKYHQKGNRNEIAYIFSGGKQPGNQGRSGPSRQGQQQTISGNNKGKRVAGNRSWKKFKGFCRYCGMQGHKASDCTVKKQRMNTPNGNKGENLKNNCFTSGKPGHYSRNCPERKQNNLGQQQKLVVGYAGEDCVYMAQEQQQAHKTNRDWHLDTSSSDNSNNNMNMEEDSDTSVNTCVTSNNTNINNYNIITCDDMTLRIMKQQILMILRQRSPTLPHGLMMIWFTTRC